MDLYQTIRKLRAEKKWFDEVIASLEEFQRSRRSQAARSLDLYLAGEGRLGRNGINGRSSRQLSRRLRETGMAGSSGQRVNSARHV